MVRLEADLTLLAAAIGASVSDVTEPNSREQYRSPDQGESRRGGTSTGPHEVANSPTADQSDEKSSQVGAESPEERTERRQRLLRGISSLTALIDAYRSADAKQLAETLEEFEKRNGEILDSYFTPSLRAAAVLVKVDPKSGTSRRRLLVRFDGHDTASIEPRFEKALWRAVWTARQTERESDYLLEPRARKVLSEMLHQITVYLLGTLDALSRRNPPDPSHAKIQLATSTAAANEELNKLESYAERASIRAAIRNYLYGLPVGAILLIVIAIGTTILNLIPNRDVRTFALSAMVAGGIGSMASVMIRITRGQKLSVDIHQGSTVTVVAGFFRPLIGAVFGVVLYVLVQGGLLPLEIPTEHPGHFFAGLGFIAGFSERWAQDTIVRSAPISPSPAAMRSDNSDKGDEESSESETRQDRP
jgi:hypothetical protein